MNVRFLLLLAGAAVAGAAFAWAAFAVVGGGDDDKNAAESPSEDPRAEHIPAFMSQQLDRFNAAGPQAIYGVVDTKVQALCSEQEWGEILENQPRPGGFVELSGVTFNDDGTADVRVAVVGGDEVAWRLTFLPNNRPKIWQIPGSEACTPG